uniref:WavE lipopolysaccharide synthesis family protein n=1 Tax=Roseivirga sp. TaxID=1964215 RepID=UPI004047EB93
MIDFKDITVVVQGPIQTFQDRPQEDGITRKCLESVRQHLPGSKIILSTWPDQDLAGLDFDELVISTDPGPNIRYYNKDGSPKYFNNNRQIASSKAGLKKVTTRYAVKLRSDNFLTGNHFVNLQEKYQNRFKDHQFFDERVVVCNVFTRMYAKGFRVAHHLSDFFYFGLTKDLLSIWGIDFYPDAKPAEDKNNRPLAEKFPIDCTQMFWLSALQKFDPSIKLKGLLDTSDNALELSDKIYANNLVIASPDELGLGLCQKFLGTARISRPTGRYAQWQHVDWQYLVTNRHPKTLTRIKNSLIRTILIKPKKLELLIK